MKPHLGSVRRGHASGKVILAGEHAAVYGFPAVAIALDRGALARAMPIESGPSTLCLGGLELGARDDHDLARAFGVVLAEVEATRASNATLPVRVEVTTSLPPGSGLGSSAAIGVAVIRALDPFAPEVEVLERAMLWERVFHGNPSGLDAFMAARGGTYVFERGKTAVPIRVPQRAFLCIGQSGAGASTRMMVDSVAALRFREPHAADGMLSAIGAIAGELAGALHGGHLREVGRLMRENQVILQRLGLSTHEIDSMCARARSAGAHGAKLTGGGGGGCVVALCDTERSADAVLTAWRRASFDGFVAPIGPSDPHSERTPACSPLEAGRPIT